MKRYARRSIVILGLAAALAGGAYRGVAAQQGGEKHPVLRQSMRQLEGVRDRLQKAPTDFGGHREVAVDHINRAISELEQAIQFDKR